MSTWGKIRYNRQRERYAVVGTWQGKRLSISQYLTIPCVHQAIADRLLSAIRSDIDQGIFNPDRYRRSKPLHLKQYAKTWLAEVEPDLSSATHHFYTSPLQNYIVPCLGHKFLPDIGHSDLKELLRSMHHLSPKSRHGYMSVLHTLLKDAHRDGHISQLPPWPRLKGENLAVDPPIEYLIPEQQIQIVEQINPKHQPIFLFMMATGCRPSEARALRKEDIKNDHILFRHAFGRRGELKSVKSKKIEPFPIYAELRDILNMAPRTLTSWVFPNPDTSRPYSRSINKMWNTACDRAKVKQIRLYQAVRHSYACQLLNSGVEKAVVSRLLRHSDPKMVERYTRYEVASLEAAAGKVRRLK